MAKGETKALVDEYRAQQHEQSRFSAILFLIRALAAAGRKTRSMRRLQAGACAAELRAESDRPVPESVGPLLGKLDECAKFCAQPLVKPSQSHLHALLAQVG